MSTLLKIVLIILALGAVAFIGYSMFSENESGSLLSSSASIEGSAVIETQEFLSRLQELNTVTIDETFFTDERFNSLQDFRQELIDEPTGRQNPFDPAF